MATLAGVTFLNQHLFQKVFGRSVEAIKGMRRRNDYRRLVATATIDLRAAPGEAQPSSSSPRLVTSPLCSPRKSSIGTSIQAAAASLIHVVREDNVWKYRAQQLATIAKAALRDEGIKRKLSTWFSDAFASPPADAPGTRGLRAEHQRPAPRSARRGGVRTPQESKKKYAAVQNLWKRNNGRTAQLVYVQHHRHRVTTLPTRTRNSRGARRTERQKQCRAGCGVPETAAYIIQSCWKTHGGRIRRHNAQCKSLAAAIQAQG